MNSRTRILDDIRAALGRTRSSPLAPRPPIVPPRVAGTIEQEIEKMIQAVNALQGNARRIPASELNDALRELVRREAVRYATLWRTPRVQPLAEILRACAVEIIPCDADKHTLAQADLGITEADFILPETGTLGLLSSPDKPRSVSLLPRVHLVLASRQALCADLHDAFAQAKLHHYLVLITGPSRTADIEMSLTIGVHGPQAYYLWFLDD